MNSVYNDYDQNVDLRWDNDMYGHFQNEIAEFKRENVLPNKKNIRLKENLVWMVHFYSEYSYG